MNKDIIISITICFIFVCMLVVIKLQQNKIDGLLYDNIRQTFDNDVCVQRIETLTIRLPKK